MADSISQLLLAIEEGEDTTHVEDQIAEDIAEILNDRRFFDLPLESIYRIISFAHVVSFECAHKIVKEAARKYGSGACLLLRNLEIMNASPADYCAILGLIRNSPACSAAARVLSGDSKTNSPISENVEKETERRCLELEEQLEAANDTVLRLENEINSLETQHNINTEQIKINCNEEQNLQKNEEINKLKDEFENKSREKEEIISQLMIQISSLSEEVKVLNAKLNDKPALIEEQSSSSNSQICKQYEEQIALLQAKIESQKEQSSKVDELQAEIESLKEKSSRVDELQAKESELHEKTTEVDKLKSEITSLKEESSKSQEYQNQIKELQDKVAKSSKLESDITSLTKENQQLKSEIENQHTVNVGEISDFKSQISSLQEQLFSLQSQNTSLKDQLSQFDSDHSQLLQLIEDLKTSEKKVASLTKERDSQAIKYSQLETKVANLLPKPSASDMSAEFTQLCSTGELNRIMAVVYSDSSKVNFINKENETGLIVACRQGNLEIAQFLIENGADKEVKDKKGFSPLFYAIESQKPVLVKYLLDEGVDVFGKTNFKVTPLILASKKGNFEIIKYLVEAGAELNLIDRYNETALSVAKTFEVREYLQSKGAK